MQNFSFLGYTVQKITGYCKFAVPPQDGGFRTPPKIELMLFIFMAVSSPSLVCLPVPNCLHNSAPAKRIETRSRLRYFTQNLGDSDHLNSR